MTVPRSGGAPSAIAPLNSAPLGMALDSTSVYWTGFSSANRIVDGGQHLIDGAVMKVSRLGGPSTTLISGSVYDVSEQFWMRPNIALDDSNVYWTDPATDGPDSGSVTKISKIGGTSTKLASNLAKPSAIAADGTNVYWTMFDAGGVMMVPRDGGPTTVLAPPDQRGGMGIAIGGGNVYWTSSAAVMRVPIAGGDSVTVESGTRSWAIATDSESIYWMSRPSLPASGEFFFNCYYFDMTLKKAPVAGGTETVLVKGISVGPRVSTSTMAVDATNVYWVDEATSSVMTVGKDGGTPTVLVAPPEPPSWSPKWVPARCPGQ